MKPGLLLILLTVSSAGFPWCYDSEVWEGRLIQFWGLSWTHEIPWMADPIPPLLQVPTPSLDEQPVILEELDGRFYEPGELSLLYVPIIDPLVGWDEDKAACLKTEALALPSCLMYVKRKPTGAYWIRCARWEQSKVPASDSKSARNVNLIPSWLPRTPVPSDIRTSLFDRVAFDESLRCPFDVSRLFVPSELLQTVSLP